MRPVSPSRLSVFLALACAFPFTAHGDGVTEEPLGERCEAFAPLIAWQRRAYAKTTAGVQASQRERGEAAVASARALFSRYLAARDSAFSSEACGVEKEGRTEFEFARGPTFFSAARETLAATGEPRVLQLLSRVEERFGPMGIPPVRFVIEGRAPSDPALSAGVARGSKSLFANLTEIPPSGWNIVFVHELIHLVDRTLDAGVAQWQDDALRNGALADAATPTSTPGAFGRIDRWLQAGLDRGFLAEYRAWAVTERIYVALREKNLQEALPWMEGLASPALTASDARRRVFFFLDPRFANPAEGILSREPFKARLASLRGRLTLGAETEAPPLGSLEELAR